MGTLLHRILYSDAWISYGESFVRSSIVLEYPKNLIFTLQYLEQHAIETENVYETFPFAERFDATTLNAVDWSNSIIVIDANDRLLVAPDPIRHLISLDRRLRYWEMEKHAMTLTSWIPKQWMSYEWLIITVAVMLACWAQWRRGDKGAIWLIPSRKTAERPKMKMRR